jgi:hypothetical protein
MFNGKFQKLSDTLLIMTKNFLTENTGEHPLLVEHISKSAISRFLGGEKARSEKRVSYSAFTRFGFNVSWTVDETEVPLAMRPHMVRHFINTVANKAGMSAFQITLWMNRDDPKQTQEYLHAPADIADLSHELLRDGTARGDFAERHYSLPIEERESHLETITEAHRTGSGYCAQSFSNNSCQIYKACELGCPYFLWVKNEPGRLAFLQEKAAALRQALERLVLAAKKGANIQNRQQELLLDQLAVLDSKIKSASK